MRALILLLNIAVIALAGYLAGLVIDNSHLKKLASAIGGEDTDEAESYIAGYIAGIHRADGVVVAVLVPVQARGKPDRVGRDEPPRLRVVVALLQVLQREPGVRQGAPLALVALAARELELAELGIGSQQGRLAAESGRRSVRLRCRDAAVDAY